MIYWVRRTFYIKFLTESRFHAKSFKVKWLKCVFFHQTWSDAYKEIIVLFYCLSRQAGKVKHYCIVDITVILYCLFLHTRQGFPRFSLVLANLILHTLIRPVG